MLEDQSTRMQEPRLAFAIPNLRRQLCRGIEPKRRILTRPVLRVDLYDLILSYEPNFNRSHVQIEGRLGTQFYL